MAKNLKYLPSVVGPTTHSFTTPYYYVYGYDGTNVSEATATDNYQTYGVLYNWAAAMAGSASSTTNPSGVRGVCPDGWHLPSEAEWQELSKYLDKDACGKLKETGIEHWDSPNEDASNETGFTALPGGFLSTINEKFFSVGKNAMWWGSSESNYENGMLVVIDYRNTDLTLSFVQKDMGISVRCIKD